MLVEYREENTDESKTDVRAVCEINVVMYPLICYSRYTASNMNRERWLASSCNAAVTSLFHKISS